jgi:hypothetical protein
VRTWLWWRGGVRKGLVVWEVGMLVRSMRDFRGVWLDQIPVAMRIIFE